MNMDFIINDGCLEKYIGNGGEITIPDEVYEIAPQAFENCNSIVSVTFLIVLSALVSSHLQSVRILYL